MLGMIRNRRTLSPQRTAKQNLTDNSRDWKAIAHVCHHSTLSSAEGCTCTHTHTSSLLFQYGNQPFQRVTMKMCSLQRSYFITLSMNHTPQQRHIQATRQDGQCTWPGQEFPPKSQPPIGDDRQHPEPSLELGWLFRNLHRHWYAAQNSICSSSYLINTWDCLSF